MKFMKDMSVWKRVLIVALAVILAVGRIRILAAPAVFLMTGDTPIRNVYWLSSPDAVRERENIEFEYIKTQCTDDGHIFYESLVSKENIDYYGYDAKLVYSFRGDRLLSIILLIPYADKQELVNIQRDLYMKLLHKYERNYSMLDITTSFNEAYWNRWLSDIKILELERNIILKYGENSYRIAAERVTFRPYMALHHGPLDWSETMFGLDSMWDIVPENTLLVEYCIEDMLADAYDVYDYVSLYRQYEQLQEKYDAIKNK